MTTKYPDKLKELMALISEYPREHKALVEKAFAFTEKAHEAQLRNSGEPFFFHLVETAKNTAHLKMGAKTIAAALLHDSVEDGVATEEEVKDLFGEEVAFLVDGVTKLGKVRFRGMRRHNESLRKLFIATSKDIRVIIIKLCDRLHNMETLGHVREDKRPRIATETLEIYAPLAYRLGITTLSRKLEDLSFPYVYPIDYQKVQEILKERSKQTIAKLEKLERSIMKKLAENDMRNFRAVHRIKGTYSLYRKLVRKKWDIEKIYDVAALRVVVPSVGDCYQVLGIIHQNYRPLPGRIKDYIAFPKTNGYQSIHTTIFTGDGGIVEIQIRTEEMHQASEFGAASHIGYKKVETTKGSNDLNNVSNKDVTWVQKLLGRFMEEHKEAPIRNTDTNVTQWLDTLAEHSDHPESEEFEDNLKSDFFRHRIFVFTPLGEVIDLPEGSTPIDFAFQIHSEVGSKTAGAKVHGKLVALDTELKYGDIVEIVTKESAKPSQKWLEMATTSEARRKIRSILTKEEGKRKLEVQS